MRLTSQRASESHPINSGGRRAQDTWLITWRLWREAGEWRRRLCRIDERQLDVSQSRVWRLSSLPVRTTISDLTPQPEISSSIPSFHGRPQAWAMGQLLGCPTSLPWKNYIVFWCISDYSKRSVDELFMHYFHNLSSAPWATPTGAPSMDHIGDFSPQTPNLPTPGKQSCGCLCFIPFLLVHFLPSLIPLFLLPFPFFPQTDFT